MRPTLFVFVLILVVGGAVLWSLDSADDGQSGPEDDYLVSGEVEEGYGVRRLAIPPR